ncbi:MAG: hypothetical protein LUE21_02940 [Oscillospiraceae bacterium]|nr:hypothetical protein [Oscillospiraceae bacterium]
MIDCSVSGLWRRKTGIRPIPALLRYFGFASHDAGELHLTHAFMLVQPVMENCGAVIAVIVIAI